MWQERTQLLIGTDAIQRLARARVLVVGLGGVGACASEMLARAGVGHLTLADADCVSSSNINRQLIALHSTVGRHKTNVLAERLRDINPAIHLNLVPKYIKDQETDLLLDGVVDEEFSEFLGSRFGAERGSDGGSVLNVHDRLSDEEAAKMPAKNRKYDFIVDAIDTLSPKLALILGALQRNIPLVSSMGAGAKLDPTQLEIADISRTHHCPLAHMLRKRLHKAGVRTGFQAVFSPEPPYGTLVECDEPNKKSQVGTISYMPALFGIGCASTVIRQLIKDE